jgi:single-stranded-DNA-specific exonuclease
MALVNDEFDIVYALDENEWNGRKTVQLLLKDLK